ncbi:hypothetical protein [Microlunatus parietis]|uniref:Lipoprotein n=1 Tax=Microlunatus parietis TaxID=682979 RepID=A0A7Y9I6C2_9ACTN|nr:hypothetical protein [Microlunatus parietis]NYE71045.1 hypothetical protein [Microlunatus parietis]
MARWLRGCWLAALLMITYGCVSADTMSPRPSPTPAPLVDGRCPRDGDGVVHPDVPDDPYLGGLAPAGFVATGVIRCLVDEPLTRKDGRFDYLVRELVGAPSDVLSQALSLPDDRVPGWHEACPARAEIPIRLLLVDATGQGYWPRIPITWCHEARSEVYAAVEAIAWRERTSFRVVRDR